MSVILNSTSVADPEILKVGGGRTTMYQPRRHLSQMHTMNYAFYTGKGGLLQNIISQ